MSLGAPKIAPRGVTPRGRGAAVGARTNNRTTPGGSHNLPASSRTAASGSRRGATPSKTRTESASSEGCDTPAGFLPVPARHPRLNLTAEQELDIMERVETGNYIKGAGLHQFLPGGPSCLEAPKPNCNQNLNGAFASLEVEESSKVRYNLSKEASRSLIDHANAAMDCAYNLLLEELKMDALEASGLSSPGPEPEENGNEKDGYELPVHLKKLDELMNSVDDYRRLMDQAVEAVFEARFAELLPQNAVAKIARMEKAARVLENFMKESSSDSMKLFFPSPKKDKSGYLPCPAEQQEELINTFYGLSELMSKMHAYLDSQKKEVNLGTKILKFAEMVDKFERDLKDGDTGLTSIEELLEVFEKCQDSSSANSSGISLGSKSSPDSPNK